MIKIISTDEERYQELKDKSLTVVPWDESKALQMTDPDESIAKALKRQAQALDLLGTSVKLDGINEDVKISMQTIKNKRRALHSEGASVLFRRRELRFREVLFF